MDIFEYISEIHSVVQNPIGPHQSHEIEGTYCPRRKLSVVPAIMPVMIAEPVIDLNKIPAKKVARIGPENAEPIMFTISITVEEDLATK
ncbi:transcriptional regulator [Candidatus Scalindua japonica]|uniref:Transcriptional regulator n=1 Tax=Candidatus Scalindua japonica TaxID=1284222 RepID=A0A286U2Q0_9BACT|nr:transcriptional regulator [Candidatus Scalindua japonica]